MLDNRARAAMIRKVERKIKAKYRKMCGWCFLIALVIGLVLGFILARQLFPAQANGGRRCCYPSDARSCRTGRDGCRGTFCADAGSHACGDRDADA